MCTGVIHALAGDSEKEVRYFIKPNDIRLEKFNNFVGHCIRFLWLLGFRFCDGGFCQRLLAAKELNGFYRMTTTILYVAVYLLNI